MTKLWVDMTDVEKCIDDCRLLDRIKEGATAELAQLRARIAELEADRHTYCEKLHALREEVDETRGDEHAACERANRLAQQCQSLNTQVEQLTAERDKAQADYRFMVERAADEKLDGYRELGAKVAAAEARANALTAELDGLSYRVVTDDELNVLKILRDQFTTSPEWFGEHLPTLHRALEKVEHAETDPILIIHRGGPIGGGPCQS